MTRALVVLCLLARVASADAPTAEQLYHAGQTAYDDKRYDDALAAWQKSFELSHLPALEFNIAQAFRLRGKPGDCARASQAYARFVALAPDSPQHDDAESFLRELAPCANEPIAPPPPPQDVKRAPPTKPIDTRALPPHGNRALRITAIVAAGAGIALVATGAYFSSQAKSLGDQVTSACANGCDWTTVAGKDADGKAAGRNQWIFYGAGAAAVVTSAILWKLGAPKRATVAVSPRPDGAMLAWSIPW